VFFLDIFTGLFNQFFLKKIFEYLLHSLNRSNIDIINMKIKRTGVIEELLIINQQKKRYISKKQISPSLIGVENILYSFCQKT
jgi:hypothetical protein